MPISGIDNHSTISDIISPCSFASISKKDTYKLNEIIQRSKQTKTNKQSNDSSNKVQISKDLLNNNQEPINKPYETYTCKELKAHCRKHKIRGYSGLCKKQLIELIKRNDNIQKHKFTHTNTNQERNPKTSSSNDSFNPIKYDTDDDDEKKSPDCDEKLVQCDSLLLLTSRFEQSWLRF